MITPARRPAAQQSRTNNERTKMQRVTNRLGLAAEASEDALLAAVEGLMAERDQARKDLEPLQNRVKDLEKANAELQEARVAADLETYKSRYPAAQREFIKGLLIQNRAATIAYLEAATEAGQSSDGGAARSSVVCNRDTARAPGEDQATHGVVALNRAVREYQDAHQCSFERAWEAVKSAKPELFQSKH
jgi:hypothetical protein